jgi:putative ABC transport system permease protein
VVESCAQRLAILLVEAILPALNGFLQRDIAFDYFREPAFGGALVVVWLVTGSAAGAYAAFVLSVFRPGVVLKGVVLLPGGSGRLRLALVIFQFGTLIALIVSTMTVQRQTQYAMQDRLRLPTEQIYLVFECPEPFNDAVSRIQGVLAASCSSGSALTYDRSNAEFAGPNGITISLRNSPVDYGFFELFAVKPLAGRLFSRDRGEDDVLRASHGDRDRACTAGWRGLLTMLI